MLAVLMVVIVNMFSSNRLGGLLASVLGNGGDNLRNECSVVCLFCFLGTNGGVSVFSRDCTG